MAWIFANHVIKRFEEPSREEMVSYYFLQSLHGNYFLIMLEERLPSIRDHSHTSKCCVLKLYYISPDYGEWNLNLSLGSSSEDEEEENLKNFALL